MRPSVLRRPIKAVKSAVTVLRLRAARHRVTADDVSRTIKALGIRSGDVIFVHSSLSRLGYVRGGAPEVIEGLIGAVGSAGTVAMPAFTLFGSMADTLRQGQVFDVRTSPSTVGVITETFRKWPGVLRSLHPTHSVAALGPHAHYIVRDHHLASSNFGPGTPLHRIMELDGWIIGLGVDFGPVTFVHVIEDTVPDFPVQVYLEETFPATVVDHTGHSFRVLVRAHNPEVAQTRIDKPVGAWIRNYFKNYLERTGRFRVVGIGAGKAWAMRARALFEAQLELLGCGVTIYTTLEEYEKRRYAGARLCK